MLAKKKRSLNSHRLSDDGAAAAKDAKQKKSMFGIDYNPRFARNA